LDTPLYFAVFGDIHGRIALMYTLANLWQKESKISLSGLLQVGDMGAFPDPNKLDRATIKHAKKDRDELGFSQFCRITPESKLYFDSQPQPKTYFIRGNHEDFDYLSSYVTPTALDPWHNLCFIPDGCYYNIATHEQPLYLAGFGGIAPKNSEPHRGKRHRSAHRKGRQQASHDPRFFTSQAISTAFYNDYIPPIDILMTHGAPDTPDSPYGSTLITALSNRLAPRIHFFGHHHVSLEPCEMADNQLLVGLEHLEFKRDGFLKEGSWGILKINNQKAEFSFCNNKEMPWLYEVRQASYRELI